MRRRKRRKRNTGKNRRKWRKSNAEYLIGLDFEIISPEIILPTECTTERISPSNLGMAYPSLTNKKTEA